MRKRINELRRFVLNASPLIHCITNPISITQCANALLALGAKPMMAEHPSEAEEITASASALLLNLGNITDVRMRSMRISALCAKEKGIPFVLDLVGIACSKLRREYAKTLLQEAVPTVIKGNYSEILALHEPQYHSAGVDSDLSLEEGDISRIAADLSRKYGCILMASGKTDIITDGKRLLHIRNGCVQLASVTGTGCMLGALTACFLSAACDITAAAAACAVLGICGELAEKEGKNGSFAVALMDTLSSLTDADVETYLRMEEKPIEEA